MTQSDLTFEAGTPIRLGASGQHDFFREEGTQVRDEGQSTLVFEEGTGLGRDVGVVDNFEDGDLSEYKGDLSAFNTQTATTQDGSYALRGVSSGDEAVKEIRSHSGLPRYPIEGDRIRWWSYTQDDRDKLRGEWARQKDERLSPRYQVDLFRPDGELRIEKRELDDSFQRMGIISHNFQNDTWYGTEVVWKSGGEFTLRLLDLGLNVIDEITATDSNTPYTEGGIGWHVNPDKGGYTLEGFFDNMQILPRQ